MADHPRIRGEHDCGVMVIAGTDGSSPHTRGAPPTIPSRSVGAGDHPRIRGEHTFFALPPFRPTGSSPHTRGAPLLHHERPRRERIIPAYAGSTRQIAPIVCSIADHPRIRGEHRRTPPTGRQCWGIIPAYAGSTGRWLSWCRSYRDHPRIRGEHTWKSLQYQGSPS